MTEREAFKFILENYLDFGDCDEIMQDYIFDAAYKLFDELEKSFCAFYEEDEDKFYFLSGRGGYGVLWENCLKDEVLAEIMDKLYDSYAQNGIDVNAKGWWYKTREKMFKVIKEMIEGAISDDLIDVVSVEEYYGYGDEEDEEDEEDEGYNDFIDKGGRL